MEKSLVLIKPDAVRKNLIGKIISKYEENNLRVVNLKMESITKEFASIHYAEHIGKDFYDPLINFITSGPLCALVLEGENAIERIRDINGSTNPEVAKEGTIRKMYASSNRENCVHASDSENSAKREIMLWFGEQ
ncbi:nucleoside-diphosphate kinase [Clostridium sp. AL.422]|uniref:nucleoside-diphosphate kinase n=1 Tax=Clostridium TaxID=1485 RepID=UPI00293DAF3C|nr:MULTISPECIES: nucleoside-diphosphate kinase [unclassified Clostridium]MDV4152555.1 nucleoside-diphosphate kinase [Clostridium sp. AL.422]